MYTRQMILENLPPHTTQNYNEVLDNLAGCYGTAVSHEEVKHMFCLETLLHRLAEKPEGYDFVLPYQVTDSRGTSRSMYCGETRITRRSAWCDPT